MLRSAHKFWDLILWIARITKRTLNLSPRTDDLNVSLQASGIHRYLLTLHRMAQQSKDRLIVHTSPCSVAKAHNFDHSRYHTAAYQECHLSFSKPSGRNISLDPHYFQDSAHFRIPIGCHPTYIYPHNIDLSKKTPNSVQFFGNDSSIYANFDGAFWGMPSRFSSLQRIRAAHPEIGIRTSDIQHYQRLLVELEFFICLPGLYMPLCHNLYESMTCGCIPLVHVNYSKWLDPKLQELLAPVTYASDEQLLEWISDIQSGQFVLDKIGLAQSLMSHVHDALSWGAIRDCIEDSHKALLCAEEISVDLAKQDENR